MGGSAYVLSDEALIDYRGSKGQFFASLFGGGGRCVVKAVASCVADERKEQEVGGVVNEWQVLE